MRNLNPDQFGPEPYDPDVYEEKAQYNFAFARKMQADLNKNVAYNVVTKVARVLLAHRAQYEEPTHGR